MHCGAIQEDIKVLRRGTAERVNPKRRSVLDQVRTKDLPVILKINPVLRRSRVRYHVSDPRPRSGQCDDLAVTQVIRRVVGDAGMREKGFQRRCGSGARGYVGPRRMGHGAIPNQYCIADYMPDYFQVCRSSFPACLLVIERCSVKCF